MGIGGGKGGREIERAIERATERLPASSSERKRQIACPIGIEVAYSHRACRDRMPQKEKEIACPIGRAREREFASFMERAIACSIERERGCLPHRDRQREPQEGKEGGS